MNDERSNLLSQLNSDSQKFSFITRLLPIELLKTISDNGDSDATDVAERH